MPHWQDVLFTRDVVSVETSRWSRITNVSAEKYVSDPVGLVSGDICGLDIFVYSVLTLSFRLRPLLIYHKAELCHVNLFSSYSESINPYNIFFIVSVFVGILWSKIWGLKLHLEEIWGQTQKLKF